ncbi:hypothetical protein [Azohydromonas lata]|uniref:Uncharacterized protein n=1 Tax=Azohydromonas lata TaxID=45677 RepID=A0ABU5IKV1_9BURK|nr:hypothetical protein [Azohydromonas lata]MDZ5459514.1 hypothetical protein [Azohydromonas lata]
MPLLAVIVWATGAPAAQAADPDKVSATLEGCRNDGTVTLPNGSGQFVCPNTVYTSGNLGKGWNELDLVPYRVTLNAGNSAPATQTYTIAVVVDRADGNPERPGYDVISAPVLNTALSDATCPATVGPQQEANPGLGGISRSLYRLLTVTQPKDTTCVFDYYARLALGSHLFPGSSLHANLALPTTGGGLTTNGIGARDVSIPVKEILPQELHKDMAASADSTVQWNLTKSPDQLSLNFGDVCAAPSSEQSREVTFTVKYEKVGTVAGGVHVITNIYAKNPAARTIAVSVTDKIYKGTAQTTLLDQASFGPVDVPANQQILVATHSATLSSDAGTVGDYLNDVVTGSYTDTVTGVPVPGTTSAAAQAQITSGTVNNASVAIADVESIVGAHLSYAVAAPVLGAFTNGYVAGTRTDGEVDWGVAGQTNTNTVLFRKTVYLDGRRIVDGVLTDTATLVAEAPSPTYELVAGPINVAITSSAAVKLNLQKTIPASYTFDSGERLEVVFRITRGGDASYQVDKTLTFNASSGLMQSLQLDGLVPDDYTVTELSSTFFASAGATGVPSGLQPQGGDQQVLHLKAGADGDDVFDALECEGTAAFNNVPANGLAAARVQKITDPLLPSGDPDLNWTFTLRGPGLSAAGEAITVQAGAGYAAFAKVLAEGTYTVTETTKSPAWLLTGASPDANGDKVCEFTVDYPEDYGRVFSCTFNNQKQGKARVVKTVQGLPLTSTQAFTFQLRQGASTTQVGTTLESGQATALNGGIIAFTTWLVPGDTYQLCESTMPGWQTTLGSFVPSSFMPPDGVATNPNVDNSILCVNFTVQAGQTKSFAVDNTPPPGGRALTIGYWKNWASCSGGSQKPVLDQTLAKAASPGLVVSAQSGVYPTFAATYYLTLSGSTATPNVAPSCTAAVNLLNKSTTDTGKKMASDPAFNLAAQLVAAELNYLAGAGRTGAATTAVNQAVLLLGKYAFNGKTHTAIGAADANTMNNLAKTLDDYNNNR